MRRKAQFREKLKSLSFPRKQGESETIPVINEITGEVGGNIVKHWDGRQDANVTPGPVVASAKPQKGA